MLVTHTQTTAPSSTLDSTSQLNSPYEGQFRRCQFGLVEERLGPVTAHLGSWVSGQAEELREVVGLLFRAHCPQLVRNHRPDGVGHAGLRVRGDNPATTEAALRQLEETL